MKSIKPKQLVRMLKKAGWVEVNQKGSHLQMKKERIHDIISIPMHNKDVPTGLLIAILKKAGLK